MIWVVTFGGVAMGLTLSYFSKMVQTKLDWAACLLLTLCVGALSAAIGALIALGIGGLLPVHWTQTNSYQLANTHCLTTILANPDPNVSVIVDNQSLYYCRQDGQKIQPGKIDAGKSVQIAPTKAKVGSLTVYHLKIGHPWYELFGFSTKSGESYVFYIPQDNIQPSLSHP